MVKTNQKTLAAIDPQMQPVVQFLWDNGYKTFMSCQGGDEHIFSNPIVGITYSGKCYYEFQNQLRLLLEDQFLYFSINLKLSSSYVTSKKKRVIWENVYVEFSKKEIPNWKAK